MPECPSCLGEGELDFRDMDAPLKRLVRMFGAPYEPMGIVDCETCEGTGVVSKALKRDLDAWAVARVDQFLAGQR